jgi:Uma2 family endonuclease
MSTVTSRKKSRAQQRLTGEHRWVVRDVVWVDYETFVDLIPEWSPLRVAFDGKDMEIMVKGRDHEELNRLFDHFIVAVAGGLNVEVKTLGELTWKRPEIDCGIEADNCYYNLPEKLATAAAAEARKAAESEYPNPDLAIEVDISPSKVDRPGIYAAMKVAELWRFDGEAFHVEQLGSDGRYASVSSSRFLLVTSAELHRWLVDEDSSDTIQWTNRIRSWARKVLKKRGRPRGSRR